MEYCLNLKVELLEQSVLESLKQNSLLLLYVVSLIMILANSPFLHP